MEQTPPQLLSQKIRIICISDTHNHTPSLPSGNLLIHAGDLTNRGSQSELSKQLIWLTRDRQPPFAATLLVAGNHDITLDTEYYDRFGQRAHNQHTEDSVSVRAGVQDRAAKGQLVYLEHEAREIKLDDFGTVSVFGSPWSRRSGKLGDWAFGYSDGEEAENLWESFIQANQTTKPIDVLVVHGPAYGLCDIDKHGENDGCKALRKAIGKVRPWLVVCGHRHEGRGCVVVEWDNVGDVMRSWEWIDPGLGNGKISLVDLTGKKGRWRSVGNGEADGHENLSLVGLFEDSSRSWTCIVNAAIMTYSYGQGKSLNKPIAVDIKFDR
jgi:3',5'-cyclic AMP phosphodiesterase CpdA